MKTRVLAVGLAVVALASCRPPAARVVEYRLDEKLQELALAFLANGDFSGVIAVSHDGEVIGEAAVASTYVQGARALDTHTSFHVASISKTFTAAAIRSLVAQDRFSLDDPLADFLPDFPASESLTIRHLLNHQSGVPDYWSLPDVGEYTSRHTPIAELIAWLGTKPLDFAPGSDTSYSNSGYALLAAVVEAASGQKYHDYLAREIFPAANLKETSVYLNDADVVGYSPAYGSDRITPSAPYDPSILIGAGSLKSTASDLLLWCKVFIDNFLDAESDTFVYGWGTREENGRRHLEQTGRNPGFSAHLRAYPDSGTCVVVLSNIESDSVAVLGAGAAAIAFGEAVTPLAKRPVISVSEDKLAAFIGHFEISPGNIVEVSMGAGGLLLRGRNGPFLPLEAIGDDKFFYRQLYTMIAAERDDHGQVTALLWGGSWRMPRVE